MYYVEMLNGFRIVGLTLLEADTVAKIVDGQIVWDIYGWYN